MDVFARPAQLERECVAFALATVVARTSPVSSHVGDRALILADGTMDGFVGGACSRDAVRREALRAIARGTPRLLRIRPEGDRASEPAGEAIVVPMGCASGGSVDVYIEPHVPLRRLIVVGDTAVADALARIAAQVPYDVVRTPAEGPGLLAVVASQGHGDEEALEVLLAAAPAYLGLVASRARAAAVAAELARRGVAPERIATIRAPAGLDVGARTPGDVAISILAEIAGVTARANGVADMDVPAAAVGIDPVCGMEVALEGARYRIEHDGRTDVFCCAGCQAAFVPA